MSAPIVARVGTTGLVLRHVEVLAAIAAHLRVYGVAPASAALKRFLRVSDGQYKDLVQKLLTLGLVRRRALSLLDLTPRGMRVLA